MTETNIELETVEEIDLTPACFVHPEIRAEWYAYPPVCRHDPTPFCSGCKVVIIEYGWDYGPCGVNDCEEQFWLKDLIWELI